MHTMECMASPTSGSEQGPQDGDAEEAVGELGGCDDVPEMQTQLVPPATAGQYTLASLKHLQDALCQRRGNEGSSTASVEKAGGIMVPHYSLYQEMIALTAAMPWTIIVVGAPWQVGSRESVHHRARQCWKSGFCETFGGPAADKDNWPRVSFRREPLNGGIRCLWSISVRVKGSAGSGGKRLHARAKLMAIPDAKSTQGRDTTTSPRTVTCQMLRCHSRGMLTYC
ncbi:uncharacterized protein LAESUDRAFT_749400 [Laetiporus sulphureus 93-53]|uniref:Uncharacterized protein n=1 Tax=Laetiporus sulphureus 93-53 TaxID=1314785 RepID=A0A165EMV9_9APHY|nr:uncharacterized protein LAESUDRAFT_749400 [Laetiporus sulphureus 93-53]KZT07395.1 hypothetical protein LAESUDRAFT_749400 [Laetiporus sulphureus 93-53]